MKIYYWNEKRNFGDLLNPLLINRFTHLPTEWADIKQAEVVSVGSILEHLPNEWGGIIAGIGKLHEETVLNLPNAKILALRGPLTAKGVKGNFVLADPGLLANELVPLEDKEYDLGIVPHLTDDILEHNPIFLKYNPKIIRVTDDPLKVIREIGKCRKIVSSALHGIILADAFGIPRRIEIPPKVITDKVHEGGIFKWQDYSASLNMKLEIGLTQQVDRNIITEKQHALFEVFEELKDIYSRG